MNRNRWQETYKTMGKDKNAVTITRTPTRFRFRLRTLFVITTLLAILLAGYVMWSRGMDRFFEAVFVGEAGPVINREEWPRPLKRLVESAREANIDIRDVQVHCVANGLTIEYVWRMNSNPGLFHLITKEYGLEDHAPPETGGFRSRRFLPEWWNPEENAETHFYAGNPSGVGDQFYVFDDQLYRTIFVHYFENW